MTSRTITGRLVDIFRRKGFDGASLTILAKGTGLGRASFYHHFPGGKSDMARAAYERASRDFTKAVLAPLAGLSAWSMDSFDAFYGGGCGACLIDVFILGGARDLFRDEITEALVYWADAIARVLVESGLDRAEAKSRAETLSLLSKARLFCAAPANVQSPFAVFLTAWCPSCSKAP